MTTITVSHRATISGDSRQMHEVDITIPDSVRETGCEAADSLRVILCVLEAFKDRKPILQAFCKGSNIIIITVNGINRVEYVTLEPVLCTLFGEGLYYMPGFSRKSDGRSACFNWTTDRKLLQIMSPNAKFKGPRDISRRTL